MRVFEIPMLAMSLLGLGLLSGLDVPPAHGGFTFGEPVNLDKVIPTLDGKTEWPNCFSYDGLELYISSQQRPGGYGECDLWVLKRASIDRAWGPPENLGPAVNTKVGAYASISGDGLTLCFNSNRPGGYGEYDIWMTTRQTKNDPWGPPVNLGPKVNSARTDACPWISPDGLEVYFQSWRTGGFGSSDIWVARRPTQNDPWGEAVNLGPVVNSPYQDGGPCLSPDGLLLFFCEPQDNSVRPGGYGSTDVWVTRRATLSDPWQTPVNLGPKVNGSTGDWTSGISPDGNTLYFGSDRGGAVGNWQAPIIPVVDFNGDKKVDLVDLVMLIDDWGKSKSVCDIGPMPWGDGKVDIEDLKVFITYYEKENPPVKP